MGQPKITSSFEAEQVIDLDELALREAEWAYIFSSLEDDNFNTITNTKVNGTAATLGGSGEQERTGDHVFANYLKLGSGPAIIGGTWSTFSDGDTTPSISGSSFWKTANTGSTTITSFDDAEDGKVLILDINDSNTTIEDENVSGNINLDGSGVDADSTNAKYIGFIYTADSGEWHEIWRSALA